MSDSPEVIKEQMEETREDLSEKLETLGEKVSHTVEDVTETVEETVETVTDTAKSTVQAVKDTFNLQKQVEARPWLMFGGAVALGFIGGRMLSGLFSSGESREERTRREDREHRDREHRDREHRDRDRAETRSDAWRQQLESHAPEHRQERGRGNGHQQQSSSGSWFGSLRETFGPEINRLTGLALGTTAGLVRDVIVKGVPENIQQQVHQVFDQITEKMGGEPTSSSQEGGGESHQQGEGQREGRQSSHEDWTRSSSHQKWEGRWDQLAGRARQIWGHLTDDDVQQAHGSYYELVGKIKEKTGQTREEIERRLNA